MCMLTASHPTKNLLAWEQKIGTLLLSNLLYLNSSKGNRDGFGFGEVDGSYWKWEDSAVNVIFTTEYNKTLRYLIQKPFIAHVRATSTGITAKEGAHPFKAGSILLAHNGTFTNYKTLLRRYTKQIKDEDPVDSNVVTQLLAEKIGDGALVHQHIADAIGETLGSYALLVTDARSETVWVITGVNPLYVQKSGPLWLVNTSLFNLEIASSEAAGTAQLLYQKTWPVETPERIPQFTTHILTNKGLVKQGKLEKPTTTVVYRPGYAYGNYRNLAPKDGSTEDARTRAEYADAILDLPCMDRLELTLSCFVLFQLEWWKMTIDDLEVLYTTLLHISDQYGSSIKQELWEELMLLTNGNAYAVIAKCRDIAFPYVLNTVEQLRSFLEGLKTNGGEDDSAYINLS